MEEMESVKYITDIANPWVSGAALFFKVTEVWGRGETLVPLMANAFYNTIIWR
jgi:hypothetical protein